MGHHRRAPRCLGVTTGALRQIHAHFYPLKMVQVRWDVRPGTLAPTAEDFFGPEVRFRARLLFKAGGSAESGEKYFWSFILGKKNSENIRADPGRGGSGRWARSATR